MRAQVIEMSSVRRAEVAIDRDDRDLAMFTKSLALVKLLNRSTPEEAQQSMDNWLLSGCLSLPERAALMEYGIGRTE